jgi:hypothetical protein
MQLANHISLLDELINRYLLVAKEARHNRQIEAIASELTKFSKHNEFLESALMLMAHGEGGKEKDTLLSSLIKDKFKYDF